MKSKVSSEITNVVTTDGMKSEVESKVKREVESEVEREVKSEVERE